MATVTLRVLIQVTIALAALLGIENSVLGLFTGSEVGPADSITLPLLGFSGPRQQIELQLRLVLTALAFTALYAHEAFAYWIPKRNLLQFRKEYLDLLTEELRDQLHGDIRVNLMFAKRRCYALWLIPILEWAWHFRFQSHHRDTNLRFCTFQGTCGLAFRTKTAQFASIEEGSYQSLTNRQRWLFANRYRLTKRQLSRTKHLRAVLSIPIIRKTEGLSPTFRAVGVINLDASTSGGAEELEANQQALAAYFTRIGKILAELRA